MGFQSREISLLFIEDDPSSVNLMMEMLSKDAHTSFKFEHKGTLKDSLKVLEDDDCNYDVILLDLMLPNSAGIDTYESIRNVCQDVPIVIIPGFEDIACQCVKRGAQDYILKPDLTPGLIARSLKYAIERKKLEQQKLNAENRFKNVMLNTPLGVHMYELSDGDLYFTGYNTAADTILNIDHSTLVGMKIENAFPNIKDIKNKYIQIIETGETWKDRKIDYEDNQIKGSFRVYAFRTNDNQMATTFEDVTVKAKMEEDLKRSQEKYKELVEVTRAAIYEVDLIQDKFIYVNDVLCELTGWSKEEFMELKPTDLLTPKSLDQFARRMQALENGEFIEPSFEYEVVVKDGSTKWTLITVKFKENEDGVVTSANVVAIDISRQKLAEDLAKQKEKSIFNELENRIHDWKEEMIQTSLDQEDRIRIVSTNIQSITNGVEVIQ